MKTIKFTITWDDDIACPVFNDKCRVGLAVKTSDIETVTDRMLSTRLALDILWEHLCRRYEEHCKEKFEFSEEDLDNVRLPFRASDIPEK